MDRILQWHRAVSLRYHGSGYIFLQTYVMHSLFGAE